MSEKLDVVNVSTGKSIQASGLGMARALGDDGSFGVTIAMFLDDPSRGPVAHVSMSLESARGFARRMLDECDVIAKSGH